MLAEGVLVVQRLLESAYPVRAMLGVRRRYDELSEVGGIDAPCYVADPQVMAEVIGFHLNRGLLASADRVLFPPAPEMVRTARTVALLEGVGDHENLGALFRNAAALGIDAVLLGPGCADPLYRRSVRVSMGHVLLVPFATVDGPIETAVAGLRSAGFTVAALTPATDAIPLAQAGLAGAKVAVLLGSEGPGLTEAALRSADLRVRIPMAAGVDSLNVATAAAIAFAAL